MNELIENWFKIYAFFQLKGCHLEESEERLQTDLKSLEEDYERQTRLSLLRSLALFSSIHSLLTLLMSPIPTLVPILVLSSLIFLSLTLHLIPRRVLSRIPLSVQTLTTLVVFCLSIWSIISSVGPLSSFWSLFSLTISQTMLSMCLGVTLSLQIFQIIIQCFLWFFASDLRPITIWMSDITLLSLFLGLSLYFRRLFDSERKKTFSGAQQLIDDRIRLEFEREQQEQLLLSVIPAYIAAEVRRRILTRMTTETTDIYHSNNKRFHELYVQRHNNVRYFTQYF